MAHIVLFLLALFCILPLLLLFSSSFSKETAILHEGYQLLPKEFDLTAYQYIVNGTSGILRSYGISAIITIGGTLANLLLTILYAYPISRGDLKGRTFFSFFLFFTILFNGGLIPTYMMWTNTFHIKNSYLAYILPNLLVTDFMSSWPETFLLPTFPQRCWNPLKWTAQGNSAYCGISCCLCPGQSWLPWGCSYP